VENPIIATRLQLSPLLLCCLRIIPPGAGVNGVTRAPSSSLRFLERQGGGFLCSIKPPRPVVPKCGTTRTGHPLQISQELLYFVQLGEEFFFGLKVGRVHTAAGAPSSSLRFLERQGGGLLCSIEPPRPVVPKYGTTRTGHPLQISQELLHFVQLGEEFFFGLKVGRVHTAAGAPQSYRVLEVEHLVIHDVLDRET
jgi:hypothetical protein